MTIRIFLLLAGLGWSTSPTWALTFGATSAVGLMQQPTSQYYHFIYGGSLQVRDDAGKFFTRLTYLERPKFSYSGFSDQEMVGFGLVGTSVLDTKKWYRIDALAGFGRVRGYLKENGGATERFQMNGFACGIEAAAKLWKLETTLGHQMFTGMTTRQDLETYVAWPYQFFYLSVGFFI